MCKVFYRRRDRRYRRGFIELRSVVAIVVIISILPIIVSLFSILCNFKANYDFINDEISLFQLRRIMLITYDIDNRYDELCFKYHNDDYNLSLINSRLILQPGYQIFLNNVDYVYFESGNGLLELIYGRNGNEKRTCIYKEKGIYIDDFSNTDDELSEYNSDDE